MPRFLAFDDNGPASDWHLAGAHLIGADECSLRGRVDFSDGQVICHPPKSRTSGLAIPFEAGGMGQLMLHTCLLPDREKPYLLAVELARHRIKMFVTKSEEWQMLDLSDEHPAMQLWEQARCEFTKALTTDDAFEADQLARVALAYGIEATERLALAHADILLHRRFLDKPAASSTLGIEIWPGRDSPALKEVIKRDFDVLCIPLRWRDLAASEEQYNWAPFDRWIEWAESTGKPVIAGPLLDFSKRSLPDWMYVWQHDYQTCRDLAYDHVARVLERYASKVAIWKIASGINVNSNFDFTEDQMLDMVRMAHLAVRQGRKGARSMVELTQPFGDHVSFRKHSVEPITFVDRLNQEGIRVDTVGVQFLMGSGRPGQYTRDLMQLSAMLDRFFLMETRVIISGMGSPSGLASETGGHWHEGWTPDVQALWAARMFAMVMSKPFVESIVWNNLYDYRGAALPLGGLFDDSGHAKPAYARLIGMRKRLKKPLGPLKLPHKPRLTSSA